MSRFPRLTAPLVPLCAVALLLGACGEPEALRTRTQAVGEPLGEYPSYVERLVLYFSNRARTAPTDFNPDDPYDPTPPLQWDLDLSKAARFHATHIIEASCWCEDHSSCCALTGTGDDVACDGAPTGCGATSPADRVSRFSGSYGGENMAMGQTTAAQAIEGWTFSPGHWANMNSAGYSKLGTGNFETAWVQDFGVGGGAIPPIGDGIHFADGQSMRFGITYFQRNTGGPRTALVIVDGECHDLELVHGTPELGAFETAVSLPAGCHRYYFHFTDGNGNDITYPSFGSFGAASGGGACEFFIDTRPADTCSPSGQTCMTGDTRHCYTGPFGTEAVGICEAGVERCVGGQWTGECRLEVGPVDELCDNALDDDCDGEVDEDCGSPEDVGAPDAGNMDDGSETAVSDPGSKEDGGGCATAPSRHPDAPSGLLLLMIAAVCGRRIRRD